MSSSYNDISDALIDLVNHIQNLIEVNNFSEAIRECENLKTYIQNEMD